MTYGFGSIISRAFKFANSAFPKFTSWFWIVLFMALFIGGTVMFAFGFILVASSAILLIPGVAELMGPSITGLQGSLTSYVSMFMGSGFILAIIGFILAVFFFFFVMGFFVRACKGKDLTLAHPWRMFGQGFLGFILTIIYYIPAAIIIALLQLGPMGNNVYFIICGVIIPVLLLIATYFFCITAVVRYAKTGKFGCAFQIPTIGRIISSAGWLRYLGFILLFSIIICAVTIVFCLVPIFGVLMLTFALPFIMAFEGGFFSELYDCGDKYKDVKIQ